MNPRSLTNTLQTLFLLVGLATAVCQAQSDSQMGELKIMSFNIRFGTANDGENRWDKRKQNVVTTIKEYEPDVLGVQETLHFQADYLQENLKDYQYFGRSRENRKQGEQCGILFRSERFDLLESGHFWLSESPNVPGSKSWDSSLPRMASWVKLFDRSAEKVFYLVNTHFDHRGAVAREKAAELIVARSRQFESGIPVVVTGDFNTAPDSAPHRVLVSAFTDSFESLHPDATQSGTFGGYRGEKTGARIDFIFTSGNLEIAEAAINHRNFDGHDPSDHFPVTSTLRFQGN